MTVCRTLAEIEAAGTEAGRALGPLTQEQADKVAAILSPHLSRLRESRATRHREDERHG
jgi:hypothetical protein